MPRSAVKVQDVLEAYILVDGFMRFIGCTSTAEITQSVESEDIRCGIGNKLRTRLFSSKDISVNVETGLYSEHFIEYQSGDNFQYGQTVSVPKNEVKTAVDNGGNIEVTITGTPVGGTVYVQDANGRKYLGAFATGTVTITADAGGENITPVAGAKYTVSYLESETTADVLDLGADKFPKAVDLYLHGVQYETETDTIVADQYWHFPVASPDGNLSLAQALATNTTTAIEFRALDDGAGSYGSYITVDR